MGDAKELSPEEKLIYSLVDTYDKLNSETPSSYVIFNDEFTMVKEFFVEVCHADLCSPYKVSPGYTTLLTAMPKVDELSNQYINWLIAGPFRSMQDKISIHEYADSYYIKCSRLAEWPANVLYNFCIATRVPIEKPDYLYVWKSLMDHGVDVNLAFALSPYTYAGLNTPIQSPGPVCNNHMWFDSASSIINITKGTFDPNGVSKPSFFAKPTACSPTNVIWGLMDVEEQKLIGGKTPLEINELLGLTKVPEVDDAVFEAEQAKKAAEQKAKAHEEFLKWKKKLAAMANNLQPVNFAHIPFEQIKLGAN